MLRTEQGALVDVPDVYAHPAVRGLAALIAERAARETETEAAGETTPDAAALPVSRLKHALCGAGQALALYPLFLFNALPLLLPFVALVTLRLPGPLLVAAIAAMILALGPLTMGLALAAKWTLIGRYRAGDHPLWGGYYIRWWLVQQIEGLVPLHVFAGSPLLVSYARLMGARIGRGAYLGTTSPVAWDLLEVADGASVGDDTSVSCYAVSGGRLQFGHVRVGRDGYVGARALVAPGATIEDGAALDALGMLGPGETAPAGERWGGSPARRLDEHDSDLTLLRACQTQRAATDPKRLPYALAAAGIMALPLVAGLPELPLVLWGYERLGGLGLLLVVPPSAVLFVLALSLLLAAVKRLLPPARPGVVPLSSATRLRHWAVDRWSSRPAASCSPRSSSGWPARRPTIASSPSMTAWDWAPPSRWRPSSKRPGARPWRCWWPPSSGRWSGATARASTRCGATLCGAPSWSRGCTRRWRSHCCWRRWQARRSRPSTCGCSAPRSAGASTWKAST